MSRFLYWIDPFAVAPQPREDVGWIYTNIARSPFFFIISAFFNTWLVGIAKFQVDGEGKVNWFGVSFNPSSYSAIYFTLYNILAAIICPIAGAMVDYTPVRKEALIGFSYGAAFLLIATAFSSLHWWAGGLIIVFTFVLYDCQIVLSSAYLPEVGTTEAERGKVSNKANVYSMLWVFFFIGIFSGLSLPSVFGSPTIALRNGSFETRFDNAPDKFKYNFLLTTIGGQVVDQGFCGGDKAHICDSVFSSEALLGGRVLQMQLPASHRLRIYQEVEKVVPESYSGLNLILYGRLKSLNSSDVSARFVISNSNTDNEITLTASERKDLSTDSTTFVSVQATTVENTNTIIFRLQVVSGEEPALVIGDDFLASNKPDALPTVWTAVTGVFWVIINLIGLRELKHRDGLKKRLTAAQFLPVVAKNLGSSIYTVFTKDRDLACFLISQGLASAASTGINSLLPVLLVDIAKLDASSTGILYIIAFIFVILGGFLHDSIARRFNYARTLLFTFFLALFSIFLGFILLNTDGIPWLIFLIGAVLGLVIGGYSVLTPVIISSMIPVGKEAEYFGLLTFFWKALSWTAPLAYTITVEATGKIQDGLIAICAFFVAGLILQLFVRPRTRDTKKPEAIEVELADEVPTIPTGQSK